MLKHPARPDGQLVLPENPIQIERAAVTAVTVGLLGRLREVPGKVGGGGHHVDGAGGIAQAEHVGVGSAADLNGIDVDRVQRDASHRLDIAKSDIGGGDAADAVGVDWIDLHVVRHAAIAVRDAVSGPGGIGAGAFRVSGVEEDVVHIAQREILHLRLRNDRDGRREVLDAGIDARAGHRIRGIVAVALRLHFERRQPDDFLGALLEGGGRIGRGGG